MARSQDNSNRGGGSRPKAGRYSRAAQSSSHEFSDRVERSRSRDNASRQTQERSSSSRSRTETKSSSSGERARTAREQRYSAARANERSRARAQKSQSRPERQKPAYLHVVENPAEREPASGSSRRVGDIRREERSEAIRSTYRHLIVRLVGVLVLVLAVVGLGLVIYHSPLFTITEIEVVGNNFLTKEEVIELADIEDGATLLRVDRKGISERVGQSAWVESVEVHRHVPHTLTIEVTERNVAASVQIPVTTESDSTSTWIISHDGTWLDAVDFEATDDYGMKVLGAVAGVPVITDASITSVPEAGSKVDDEAILDVLEILAAASTELRSQIVAASAPTPEQITFTLANGVQVAFGSATDIQAKERVVLQLLAEHEGAISYINVRVVDRPAWRGLEESSPDAAAAVEAPPEEVPVEEAPPEEAPAEEAPAEAPLEEAPAEEAPAEG